MSRIRANARMYGGERKKDVTISLTETAAEQSMQLAESLGISRSQLFELFARGEIKTDTYNALMGELRAS